MNVLKLIRRDLYLDKAIGVLGTPDIKVITGIRRCGKSKLMEALKDYIIEKDEMANVIHINFNLHEFLDITDSEKLFTYVEDRYIEGTDNVLLIDEIQMCEGFEKAVNSLHASEKYDIYITGSNAFLLSSDLATLFTGRTFEIKVYPFSLEEYMRYFEYTDPYKAFDRYVYEGGMAGSYLYNDETDKYDYINDVFRTLIMRDIRQKYKIRKTDLLEKITDFLMDNISNLTSVRAIADTLTSNKDPVNHMTVSSYIDYLCNAFAFYKFDRYDIRGKRYLSSTSKFYLCDHSFRYAKLGTRNMDFGRTYENIVAIELLRRGYEAYVGILYKKEIDFVAVKHNEKIYIQVADNISSEETFRCEVTPLLEIKDAYPKILIAHTGHDDYQYEGIKVTDISNWLLHPDEA